MTFKEAFEAMKKGAKVKLPSWGGYWYWDDDKNDHHAYERWREIGHPPD